MKHECSFEAGGHESGSFNHVNNAVYLNYIEAARWDFFNDNKWLDYMRSQTLHPVVIEINIRFIQELKVFDKAVIKSRWRYDGDYLIADQNIYSEKTNKKVVESTVKMILVSLERVVHELPEFIKNELDKKVMV